MRTLKAICSYDGTDFSGFQRQTNARSVQAEIEDALGHIVGHGVTVAGAGRTDSGVHALGQVVSFVTSSKIQEQSLLRAMNSNLPDDVRILSVEEADEGFHARFSAVCKCYMYRIWNGEVEDIFMRRYAWHVPYRLDFDSMKAACSMIKGNRDFAAMQASGSPRNDTIRNVYELDIEWDKEQLLIRVEADGFLYKMVRNIAGLLVEVGKGRLQQDKLSTLFESKDRRLAPPTAPAKGLTLMKVRY